MTNRPKAEHDPRFDLDGGQLEAFRSATAERKLAIACNADSDDAVAVIRHGDPGDRLAGRVSVNVIYDSATVQTAWIAAPQARALAAALLDAADELDGVTPLVFTPPPFGYYIAEDAEGDPCVWRERPESSLGDECVARYSTDLTDGRAWDDLLANLPRRAVVIEGLDEDTDE